MNIEKCVFYDDSYGSQVKRYIIERSMQIGKKVDSVEIENLFDLVAGHLILGINRMELLEGLFYIYDIKKSLQSGFFRIHADETLLDSDRIISDMLMLVFSELKLSSLHINVTAGYEKIKNNLMKNGFLIEVVWPNFIACANGYKDLITLGITQEEFDVFRKRAKNI